MTPAERERLHLLQDTLLEATRRVAMALKWDNWDSTHPSGIEKARHQVERGCGEVRNAMLLMCESGDVRKEEIHRHADTARMLTARTLARQEVSIDDLC